MPSLLTFAVEGEATRSATTPSFHAHLLLPYRCHTKVHVWHHLDRQYQDAHWQLPHCWHLESRGRQHTRLQQPHLDSHLRQPRCQHVTPLGIAESATENTRGRKGEQGCNQRGSCRERRKIISGRKSRPGRGQEDDGGFSAAAWIPPFFWGDILSPHS